MLTLRMIGVRDYSVLEDGQHIGRIRFASERTPGVWLWHVQVHIPGPWQRQQPRRRQAALQGGVAGVQGEARAGGTGGGLSRDEPAQRAMTPSGAHRATGAQCPKVQNRDNRPLAKSRWPAASRDVGPATAPKARWLGVEAGGGRDPDLSPNNT